MLGAPVPCPRSWLVSASRELCGVDEAGAQSVVRSFGMSYLYEPAAKAPALPRARAAPASTGTALVCEILYSSRKRGALKSEISLTQARSGPRLNPDITYTAAHRIQDLYISACQAASTPSMFELRVCTPPLLRGETVLLGCCVPETGKQNYEPFHRVMQEEASDERLVGAKDGECIYECTVRAHTHTNTHTDQRTHCTKTDTPIMRSDMCGGTIARAQTWKTTASSPHDAWPSCTSRR